MFANRANRNLAGKYSFFKWIQLNRERLSSIEDQNLSNRDSNYQ